MILIQPDTWYNKPQKWDNVCKIILKQWHIIFSCNFLRVLYLIYIELHTAYMYIIIYVYLQLIWLTWYINVQILDHTPNIEPNINLNHNNTMQYILMDIVLYIYRYNLSSTVPQFPTILAFYQNCSLFTYIHSYCFMRFILLWLHSSDNFIYSSDSQNLFDRNPA